jgi:site-specific DNA-cytosine methylase
VNAVYEKPAATTAFQDVTGTLSPGAHPGGFNGQDAYNGMLVRGSVADEAMAVDCRNSVEGGVNGTLQNTSFKSLNANSVCREGSLVRRLTPTECERLQGFPDGWTDIGEWVDTKGKVHKPADSPRYKALGNSIAVGYANNQSGFWMWLMKRISAQYERSATLGSLFDGIGGFPLAWEFYNGKGSAIWASEIEEFPIAVTKRHFPEEEEEKEGK